MDSVCVSGKEYIDLALCVNEKENELDMTCKCIWNWYIYATTRISDWQEDTLRVENIGK